MRYETTQRLQRLLRPVFLHETNGYDNCDREGDAESVIVIAHDERDTGRCEKEENQGFLELLQEPEPQGLWLLMGKLIRAIASEANFSFSGGQAMQ